MRFAPWAIVLWTTLALPAFAHLGGEQSVDQVVYLRRDGDKLVVRVDLDMAEFPSAEIRGRLDTSGDRQISTTEERLGLRALAREMQQALRLRIGGEAIRLKVKRVTFLFGGDRSAANIPLKVSAEFHADWPASFTDGTVSFENRLYADRTVGFVRAHLDAGAEAVATGDPDVTSRIAHYEALNAKLVDGKVPELPAGEKPPQFRTVDWTVAPRGTEPPVDPVTPPTDAPTDPPTDTDEPAFSSDEAKTFWRFFKDGDYGLFALLAISGLAFLYGMGHALTPGHGKAITGAFLVGNRGTVWDAIVLGITVTITHTAAVFALGILADLSRLALRQDEAIHWLELISAVLIIGLGLFIFVRHLWALATGTEVPHGHSHDHLGGHGHQHGHEHGHAQGHGHEHARAHDHDHGHEHAHAGVAPAAAARPRPRLSEVIYLGVTGGMVPCPTGLVIITVAMSYDAIGLGLFLATVFSVGMAIVLVGIGIATVKGYGVAEHFGSKRVETLFRVLPVLSGAFIVVLGLAFLGTTMGWIAIPWLRG